MSQSRALNSVTMEDYLLSPVKRADELPLGELENDPEALINALFYLYGACETVDEGKTVVHNLLRKFGIWDGS